MKEIGSSFEYFDSIKQDVTLNVFDYLKDYNCIFFDSGRSALKSLLTFISKKNVLMPSYICESVLKCFDGFNIDYYELDNNLQINWNKMLDLINDKTDVVYLYFFNSYIGDYDIKKLIELKNKYNFIIIEDTTHSFFTNKMVVGDYAVCSLRKWFPIPDGGVLYSKNSFCIEYNSEAPWIENRCNAMFLKKKYIDEGVGEKNVFLSLFFETENELDKQKEVFKMSKQSTEILKKIDVIDVIEQRAKNAKYIMDNLINPNIKIFSMGFIGQIPLFVSLHVENRDMVRKELCKKRIYCPIHWPMANNLKKYDSSLYNEKYELSIPIDQRYSCKDMSRITKCLNELEV